MSNLFIFSNFAKFKSDIISQINLYAPEFDIVNQEDNPDIVVIDEDKNILNAWLQKPVKVPIIFITSDETFENKDVYYTLFKPLLLSNFINRLKASINIFANSYEGVINFGHYKLAPMQKEITNSKGKIYKLTEKEVAIIKYLYSNSDRIVSKDELMQEVWGYSLDVSTHTVETHIYRLRQKVEGNEDTTFQLVKTTEGGYQLNI